MFARCLAAGLISLLCLTACSDEPSRAERDAAREADIAARLGMPDAKEVEQGQAWCKDVFEGGGGINMVVDDDAPWELSTQGSLRLITGHSSGAAHSPEGIYIRYNVDSREDAIELARSEVGLLAYACKTEVEQPINETDWRRVQDEAAELAGPTYDAFPR